jgi:hypothetical protein
MTSQAIAESAGLKSKRGFFGVAMLLLAPLALFGLLALPNEYQAMGIEEAVDCDGPLGIFMFALPALLVYAPGFVLFVRSAFSTHRVSVILIAVVSGLVCLGLAANTALATREYLKAEHKESCGASL